MQFLTGNNKTENNIGFNVVPIAALKFIIASTYKSSRNRFICTNLFVINAPIKIPIGDAAKTILYHRVERFISLTTITCGESIHAAQVN